jgi:molybdenum cofactor guanylyltransferase
VFAGGRGSRLGGVRKALASVGGRTILERTLEALGPLADEWLALVQDAGLPTMDGVVLVVDPQPYAGPLPALGHGLRVATGDVCLLVASDMPFVSREAFAYLLRLQTSTGARAVVPFVDGFIESMHSVVARLAMIEAIERAQASGERRLFKVLEMLQPRLVHAEELRAVDPDLLTLFNVNTPEDLARAETLARLA